MLRLNLLPEEVSPSSLREPHAIFSAARKIRINGTKTINYVKFNFVFLF